MNKVKNETKNNNSLISCYNPNCESPLIVTQYSLFKRQNYCLTHNFPSF